MFSKKEYKNLIVCAITLGFLFSFAEWGFEKFSISIGIANLLISFVISLIILLSREFIRKLVAKKIGFEVEFNLWTIKGKGLKSRSVPIGIIISLITIFISNGSFIFASLSKFDLKSYSKKDLKRRYEYIRGIEEAVIASVGALVPTVLALLFALFYFQKAILISTIIAIYSIVPLPSQDGLKMYFGSIWYYLLITLFTIFSLIFLKTLNPLLSLIIAASLAVLITFLSFYQLNK